jgi:signal transduction histidine kinase
MIRPAALALILALPATSRAVSEAGNPSIRTFRPADYRAQTQNWAVVQDGRGFIYVGNSDGVLEFDGVRWRLIPTAGRGVVRSLAVDAKGRVYVGSVGEVGYLAPDALGRMAFVSLNDRIDPSYPAFSDVWAIHPTSQGVYFFTSDSVMFLGPGGFRSWQVETPLHLGFGLGERFFVQQLGVGLLELDGQRLVPVPGGDSFRQDKIYFMLPWDGPGPGRPPRMLLGTRGRGLLLHDGKGLTPFRTQADAFLKANLLYQAAILPDRTLAVGTLSGGIVILDREGRLVRILDKETGLPDPTVYALSVDRQGGLWAGLGAGLARIQWPSRFSRFDGSSGLAGSVLCVHRHQGRLYVGTSQGLFLLDPKESHASARFRPVEGLKAQTWELLSLGDSLLAANYQGVYDVKGGRASRLPVPVSNVLALRKGRSDPQRVFLGLASGLASMRRRGPGSAWVFEGTFPGIAEPVRTLLETGDGRLWTASGGRDLLRVTFAGGTGGAPVVERMGAGQGLPAWDLVNVVQVGGQAVFATDQGVYRFDEAGRRFHPDPRFAMAFREGPRRVLLAEEDDRGRVWLETQGGSAQACEVAEGTLGPDGAFRWEWAPYLRFASHLLNAVRPEPGGVVWFGSAEGLLRFDPSVPSPPPISFSAHVRQVLLQWDRRQEELDPSRPQRLPAGPRTLRFEFAATRFDGDAFNRYQVRLDGQDPDWSPWTDTTFKEYSFLPPGRYVFRVRAMDRLGSLSEEGRFAFVIPPPWHQTWWARALLLALAGGGLAAGHRVRTRLLRRRNAALQKRIAQAVLELQAREERLAAQARDLEAVNRQLKAASEHKSQLLGIVAHDLRNPLGGIFLASQMIQESAAPPETLRGARKIAAECQEMDALIGRCLDFAAMEAGNLQPRLEPCPVDDIAAQVVERHSFRASHKGITLALESPGSLPRAQADPSFVREILDNLLSNAVKFSPGGTAVSLRLSAGEGRVHAWVQDQGPGFTPEDRARLFVRFSRLSAHPTGGERSLGLGLSIVKHMVDALGGSIEVETQPGKGATFHVALPALPE